MNTTETQFLTTEQVAARYGLSPATIKDWRAKKFGPPYYTLGKVRGFLGYSPGPL